MVFFKDKNVFDIMRLKIKYDGGCERYYES